MATFALPSARIILLKLLLRIKNGIPAATIFRYWDAYPIVSALAPIIRQTGFTNIQISTIETTPMTSPVQKQNEEVFFAFSSFPSPNILEIREVPPIPKSMPTAIKNKNAGVATETAATI